LQRFSTGAYKLENLGSFYGFLTAKNRLTRTVVGCELSVVGLQRFPTGAYKLENLGSFLQRPENRQPTTENRDPTTLINNGH